MPKFVGIDPSLTRTGVVVVDTDTGHRQVASFSSPTSGSTVRDKNARLETLSGKVFSAATSGGYPTLVGIEGPAYSSNQGKVWDRAGLWWYIVKGFLDCGVPVVEVPPTNRTQYGSGRGNAGKDEVLLAASRTYPDFEITNNDQADALIICAMVARLSEHPFDGDLPQNKLKAMDKLRKHTQWEM